MKKFPLLLALPIALFLTGCKASTTVMRTNVHAPAPAPVVAHKPGALVSVSMDSKVGALLDEIPKAERDAVAKSLIAQPEKFWKDRATTQVHLATFRLAFRNDFYEGEGRQQLPLPSDAIWKIDLKDKPFRETVNGHDMVVVKYRFGTTLLTDEKSPGESEPKLKDVGGKWDEPFIFPIDPEFVFQRTGFACIDEGQFPPNSVDPEEVDTFYDQTCEVEDALTNTGCHQTMMPKTSCVDALKAKIGEVETAMHFEHVEWNDKLADGVRLGTVTNPTGADLQTVPEEFRNYRFNYRYIPADSCTLVEKCIAAPGWRRVLQFSTADKDTGSEPLDIGPVDYFLDKKGSVLSEHGIYEFSACHQHYHFAHYGSFTLGGDANLNRKNGFCLQSTYRFDNNELSPLHHPFEKCDHQGVSVGWADEYKAGIECQWLDVTDVKPAQTLPLSFTSNPDRFLCEGTPKLDKDGHPLFAPSEFKTAEGKTVDRPQCDFFPGWEKNNTDTYDVTIPAPGDGYVTAACRAGLFGPVRNCGFRKQVAIADCTPGKKVMLDCAKDPSAAAQVVRVCEASKALKDGVACTFNDALASAVLEAKGGRVTFTCPARRDAVETGGSYSLYTAPLMPDQQGTPVDCLPKK
jgi:hypothetical protein